MDIATTNPMESGNDENGKSSNVDTSPLVESDPALIRSQIPKVRVELVSWPTRSTEEVVQVEDPIPLEKMLDYEDLVGDTPDIPANNKEVSWQHLRGYYHLSMDEAALKFQIGLTQMKHICRTCNVKRWPFRQIKSLMIYQKHLEEVGAIVKIEKYNEWIKVYNEMMLRLKVALRHIHERVHEENAGLTKEGVPATITDGPKGTAASSIANNTATSTTIALAASAEDNDYNGENIENTEPTGAATSTDSTSADNHNPLLDYVSKITYDCRLLVTRLIHHLGDGNPEAVKVSKKSSNQMWQDIQGISPSEKGKKGQKEAFSYELTATIKHCQAADPAKSKQKNRNREELSETELQVPLQHLHRGWLPADLKLLHPVQASSIDPLAATIVSTSHLKEWWSKKQEPYIPDNFLSGKSNKRARRDKEAEVKEKEKESAEPFHYFEGPVLLPPLNLTEPIVYDKQGPLILVEPHLPSVRNLEVVLPRFGVDRILDHSPVT